MGKNKIKFERVLIDSEFVSEGNFSRVNYHNLMEYLTLDKLKLLVNCSGSKSTIEVDGIIVQETRKDHLENGVVVEYLSQHPNYALDEGSLYKKGKTFCCVLGPVKEGVDGVAEIILETQRNQDHEDDEKWIQEGGEWWK